MNTHINNKQNNHDQQYQQIKLTDDQIYEYVDEAGNAVYTNIKKNTINKTAKKLNIEKRQKYHQAKNATKNMKNSYSKTYVDIPVAFDAYNYIAEYNLSANQKIGGLAKKDQERYIEVLNNSKMIDNQQKIINKDEVNYIENGVINNDKRRAILSFELNNEEKIIQEIENKILKKNQELFYIDSNKKFQYTKQADTKDNYNQIEVKKEDNMHLQLEIKSLYDALYMHVKNAELINKQIHSLK